MFQLATSVVRIVAAVMWCMTKLPWSTLLSLKFTSRRKAGGLPSCTTVILCAVTTLEESVVDVRLSDFWLSSPAMPITIHARFGGPTRRPPNARNKPSAPLSLLVPRGLLLRQPKTMCM